MRKEDKKEFSEIGFDLENNPTISFIYRIQIVARRISFFKNFYKKFATEDSVEVVIEPDLEYLKYKGIEFVKMIFVFKEFKTEDVVKSIIIINDCVRFISELFGYTEDNEEVILAEFLPGAKLKVINRIDDGYFTVIGYDFNREKKSLKYKVTKGDEVLILDPHFLIN
jgi:hypothetical protein